MRGLRLLYGFLAACVMAFLLGLAWPASAQQDTDFQGWIGGGLKPAVLVLGGYDLGGNLGETPGPVGQCILQARWWEAESRWDGSSKMNVGLNYRGGWTASQRLDALIGPVLVGAEFVHRNGGLWTKNTTWARVGYSRVKGTNTLHVVFRMPVRATGTLMDERIVQVEDRLRLRSGRVVVSEEVGLLSYREQGRRTVGYFMVVTAGVVL